jgi:putative ABC transport system permease protein
MNFRFILREIAHSRGQAWIFVLSVALSLVSIVALNSFRRDIYTSLMSDARNLHGADVIARSHYLFLPAFEEELRRLSTEQGVTVLRGWEFYSVARSPDGDNSVLSSIKVVEQGYPLYGSITLESARAFSEVLQPGTTIVAPALLERLGLQLGDRILLGDISLEIVDLVTAEPQRPVEFFNFGPRILVSAADLEKMGLVQKGSRVHFEALIKLEEGKQLEPVVERLEQFASGQERISSYDSAQSRVKRFFDNLLFFLSLISIFTLLLAGIGMQSGLSALFRRKEKTIAILRSFGANRGFLLVHYLSLTLLLSLLGCLVGIAGGYLLQQTFTSLFAGLLPANISLGFSVIDVLEGLGLGLIVAGFFTFLPLSSLLQIKPAAVFRHESINTVSRMGALVFVACGTVILLGLFVRQLEDLKIGLYFLGGFLALIFCLSIMVKLLLVLLPQSRTLSLELRQAIRSLFRPGNATRSVMVTLSCALAVLLTIELVENNLHSTYIASYPEDAPNLFCLDIQKNQKEDFLDLVGGEVELFPVIRARLTAINDKKISRDQERKRRGDSLSREFNLTYRDKLLDDEEVVKGNKGMFDPEGGQDINGLVQVSVLDSVAKLGGMKMGDILSFTIQGLPVQAQISSIRSRTKSMLYPFFYFVFQGDFLEAVPQTFFAALSVDSDEISRYENLIVNRFPNISTINVSAAAAELGRLTEKLSRVIDFFALFSILAGGLILVSSILATRLARMQEGVYYRVLGAKSGLVLRVFLYENLILALLSGLCAVIVAQTASWGLSYFLFDISHDMHWWACLLIMIMAVVLVVSLGLAASYSIIRQKPAEFLRDLH